MFHSYVESPDGSCVNSSTNNLQSLQPAFHLQDPIDGGGGTTLWHLNGRDLEIHGVLGGL